MQTLLGALLIVAANVQLVVSGCAAAPSSNIAVRPSSAQLIQLRITRLIILPAISGDSADISIAVLKAPGHNTELLEYHAPPTATDPISNRAISGQCTLLSPLTSRNCSGKGCSVWLYRRGQASDPSNRTEYRQTCRLCSRSRRHDDRADAAAESSADRATRNSHEVAPVTGTR